MQAFEIDHNFTEANLEHLIIKDKAYKRKKMLKIIIIIILLLIFLGIIAVFLIYFLIYRGGKIICSYETTKDNEEVQLINIKDGISFSLKIDEKGSKRNDKHLFEKAGLHNVTFHFKKKLESLDGLFKGINHLIEADFTELETEEIKSMGSTFAYCKNLKKVNFNTETPNLEDMSYMFFSCESLNTANLNLDTSKVKRMDFMFYNCRELINLDLSSFNLENLSNAPNMFAFCIKLNELKFKDTTNTNNLEEMNEMFSHCESLEQINTKIFKTKKNKLFKLYFRKLLFIKRIRFISFRN